MTLPSYRRLLPMMVIPLTVATLLIVPSVAMAGEAPGAVLALQGLFLVASGISQLTQFKGLSEVLARLGTLPTPAPAGIRDASQPASVRLGTAPADQLGAQVTEVSGRVGALEAQVTQLDGRMDQLESRMGRLEGRMDRLDERVTRIEHQLTQVGVDVTKIARFLERVDVTIDVSMEPGRRRERNVS